MSWVLEEMKARHWKEVLSTADDPDIARAFTFIANLNRVNWQYLLSSGRGRAALCIGEGRGTTAHALSGNYATVVATEQVLARVDFMRRRFEQDEIENVRVVRAAFPDLPFADGSFDLVVFNGVLEWLPSRQPSEPPAEVQRASLRKAFRLLKPGGHVYVGIENRWCYEYFLGAKDPHIGVPWVTILPRWIANWRTRRVTGRRYDTYLYGRRGYEGTCAFFAGPDSPRPRPSWRKKATTIRKRSSPSPAVRRSTSSVRSTSSHEVHIADSHRRSPRGCVCSARCSMPSS